VHIPKVRTHYLNFNFFCAGVTNIEYGFDELVASNLSSG
jgi:hypothetical protein